MADEPLVPPILRSGVKCTIRDPADICQVAQIWLDEQSHLHIQLYTDGVCDVVFEGDCQPRYTYRRSKTE